jgi:hypothetical protein
LHGKKWEIMAEKGFPTHLIKTVQSMYQNSTLIIRKNRVNDHTPTEIKELDKDFVYPRYCLIFTLTKSSKIGCNRYKKIF